MFIEKLWTIKQKFRKWKYHEYFFLFFKSKDRKQTVWIQNQHTQTSIQINIQCSDTVINRSCYRSGCIVQTPRLILGSMRKMGVSLLSLPLTPSNSIFIETLGTYPLNNRVRINTIMKPRWNKPLYKLYLYNTIVKNEYDMIFSWIPSTIVVHIKYPRVYCTQRNRIMIHVKSTGKW